MVAPVWLCVLFTLAVYVVIPLDAWLCALPAATADRNARVLPTYRHEF